MSDACLLENTSNNNIEKHHTGLWSIKPFLFGMKMYHILIIRNIIIVHPVHRCDVIQLTWLSSLSEFGI